MNPINFIIVGDILALTVLNPETGRFDRHRIPKDSPSYASLLAILGSDKDAETRAAEVVELLKPVVIEGLTVEGDVVEFEGTRIPPVLLRKLEELKNKGLDFEPFKKFITRLAKNPSANSVNELYDFLSYRDLPITEDGYFLAYKGVQEDYYSVHGNPDTLVEEGVVDENFKIRNMVGDTVRVNRNQVDDDRANECSFGLHVGSFNYASTFSKRTVLVKVDPADAVAVPRDCSFQKLRVCAYTVIAEETPEVTAPLATEKGEGIDGEDTFGVSKANFDAYKQRVLNHLDGIEASYDDDAFFYGEVAPVDFNECLRDTGGESSLALQSVLQDCGYYWEMDESGNPKWIYLD